MASEHDLAFLDPDRTPYQTACALLARGPAVVLLTNGSLGVKVLAARREALVEAPGAQVVDTIGAGDAFGAHGWGPGWPRASSERISAISMRWCGAAEFAVLVAARTCERAGPEPPRGAKVDSEWCLE